MEELKKQSFIISENSTQKMEVKESLNIGEQIKNEKKRYHPSIIDYSYSLEHQ